MKAASEMLKWFCFGAGFFIALSASLELFVSSLSATSPAERKSEGFPSEIENALVLSDRIEFGTYSDEFEWVCFVASYLSAKDVMEADGLSNAPNIVAGEFDAIMVLVRSDGSTEHREFAGLSRVSIYGLHIGCHETKDYWLDVEAKRDSGGKPYAEYIVPHSRD